jgi:hypothetical protein
MSAAVDVWRGVGVSERGVPNPELGGSPRRPRRRAQRDTSGADAAGGTPHLRTRAGERDPCRRPCRHSTGPCRQARRRSPVRGAQRPGESGRHRGGSCSAADRRRSRSIMRDENAHARGCLQRNDAAARVSRPFRHVDSRVPRPRSRVCRGAAVRDGNARCARGGAVRRVPQREELLPRRLEVHGSDPSGVAGCEASVRAGNVRTPDGASRHGVLTPWCAIHRLQPRKPTGA